MTPAERRARGYAAKALIDDPTLQQGWECIENELRAEWEGAMFLRKRERIWAELKHLKSLRQKLASYASQGRE